MYLSITNIDLRKADEPEFYADIGTTTKSESFQLSIRQLDEYVMEIKREILRKGHVMFHDLEVGFNDQPVRSVYSWYLWESKKQKDSWDEEGT